MDIPASLVKELRDKTNAGVMECKTALQESSGDVEAAIQILRKRGLAIAEKKAQRAVPEGIVASYIHLGGKIGVLVEVNCETDFVARTDEFKQFAKDVAMQVAAMSPMVVRQEDLPEDVLDREKEIYRTQALNEGKPEKVVDRIVEGRLGRFYQEACLLDQPFVKDSERTIRDVQTELIAKIGENITIRRFARFRLGGDEV